jgi:hypothetical protein
MTEASVDDKHSNPQGHEALGIVGHYCLAITPQV